MTGVGISIYAGFAVMGAIAGLVVAYIVKHAP